MPLIPFVCSSRMLALSAAAVFAVSCSDVNPARPSGQGRNLTDASLQGVPSIGGFPVGPELAEVRKATARFHDIDVAYAAGYTTENEPCVSNPDGLGAMGIHAPNHALLIDPAVDPGRPELLLYEPMSNGKHRLVGVEYFQAVLLRPVGTTGDGEPRLDPSPWNPVELEIVNPAPQLFGQSFHLSPPPAPGVPWNYELHAWIWVHNPSGTFEDWNPRVRCPQ